MVYVYDGLNIIYEKNITSGISTDLYYGDGTQLAKTVNSATYYFLKDLLGSTRIEVNSQGQTVFSSNYKPFGLSYDPTGVESFMYTGKVFDSSTGLYYYSARFYDPSIQRFVSEDSYAGTLKDTQALNRYVYVNDNPITFNDSTGHYVIPYKGYSQTIFHDMKWFSWGYALLVVGMVFFYPPAYTNWIQWINEIITLIGVSASSVLAYLGATTVAISSFAASLIGLFGYSYISFLNWFKTTDNREIAYVEIGVSVAYNQWNALWGDTLYAEVGAYSDMHANLWGPPSTFSWQYNPFFSTGLWDGFPF